MTLTDSSQIRDKEMLAAKLLPSSPSPMGMLDQLDRAIAAYSDLIDAIRNRLVGTLIPSPEKPCDPEEGPMNQLDASILRLRTLNNRLSITVNEIGL